jgi:hypothetical protein
VTRALESQPVSAPQPTHAQAERAFVVVPMKSGTHLIQELMVALGYEIYGQSRIPPEIRPVLDDEARRRVTRMVFGDDALEGLDDAALAETAERAWDALGWAWQLRLGLPLANRYGLEITNTTLVEETLRRTASSGFADTPSGVCWILPELDVTRVDGRFLREWSETGEPRLLFMYRDPRDVVLSMVNFLCGKTAQGFGTFSEFQVFSRILTSKATLEAQLAYALGDPAFPGADDYTRCLWLLEHPDVCRVSFEELVGPEGGGSADAQRQAIERIVAFLGFEADASALAGRLFRRDAFSFYKGQIGAWREVFTPELEELAERRYGDVLELYGYRRRGG